MGPPLADAIVCVEPPGAQRNTRSLPKDPPGDVRDALGKYAFRLGGPSKIELGRGRGSPRGTKGVL